MSELSSFDIEKVVVTDGTPSRVKFLEKCTLQNAMQSPIMCSIFTLSIAFAALLALRPPIVLRKDYSISWVAVGLWSLIAAAAVLTMCYQL